MEENGWYARCFNHDYEETDFEKLWEIIEIILPQLKNQLIELQKNL